MVLPQWSQRIFWCSCGEPRSISHHVRVPQCLRRPNRPGHCPHRGRHPYVRDLADGCDPGRSLPHGFRGVITLGCYRNPASLAQLDSSHFRRPKRLSPKLGCMTSTSHRLPAFVRPAVSLAAAACLAGLFGSTPAVSALSTAPSAPASVDKGSAASKVNIKVENPQGTLKSNDEKFLVQETSKIKFPSAVKSVTYLVIDGESDNLNDDVVEWVGKNRPDLVPDGTGKGATWKLGELIVAVSTEKRHNGIYCGNDVCSALKLGSGDSHLERSLDEMKPSFKDERWAAGLLEGAKAAADPSLEKEDNGPSGKAVAGTVGAVGAVAGAIGAGAYVSQRRKKTAEARKNFSYISSTYGETAQKLDQIDIRANSLTSPLAHAELRSQWESIRRDFLDAHSTVDQLGLTPDSTDKEFHAKRKEIEEAHSSVSKLENADKNINTLFDMERGDGIIRKREIASLREDISEALNAKEIKKNQLVGVQTELHEADQELRALETDLEAPDFMDRFAMALRKHSHAMEQISSHMKKLKLENHSVPDIGDSSWRPGYGYNGWYPYFMLSSWHSADVSAASSGSSGGVNTSFSSGFSGGGGSSSF